MEPLEPLDPREAERGPCEPERTRTVRPLPREAERFGVRCVVAARESLLAERPLWEEERF